MKCFDPNVTLQPTISCHW